MRYENYCDPGILEWSYSPKHVVDVDEIKSMWDMQREVGYATSLQLTEDVVEKRKTIEQRFREEAEKWDRETSFISSTPKKVLHESYQKIMAMGPDVVPFILRDLQQTHRSWFWALRHLTQANPVSPEDQGNIAKMVAAWVAWGKREARI